MPIKPKVLFASDLYYEARQRAYNPEDIFITSRLREIYNLAICHPKDIESFEDHVDAIIIRNTGPIIYHKKEFFYFVSRAKEKGLRVYNALDGRCDVAGKQYLVDLTHKKRDVIPTVDNIKDLSVILGHRFYIAKPKDGADSIGFQELEEKQLSNLKFENLVVQPKVDFQYEVSFYFIDNELQHALYAPNPEKRWELKEYEATDEDRSFAQSFADWNPMSYGIQRVDACRTKEGKLLLMEIEDINPFLNLLDIRKELREGFIENFFSSIKKNLF